MVKPCSPAPESLAPTTYYVISASSFDKVHLNRGQLVKRKET